MTILIKIWLFRWACREKMAFHAFLVHDKCICHAAGLVCH